MFVRDKRDTQTWKRSCCFLQCVFFFLPHSTQKSKVKESLKPQNVLKSSYSRPSLSVLQQKHTLTGLIKRTSAEQWTRNNIKLCCGNLSAYGKRVQAASSDSHEALQRGDVSFTLTVIHKSLRFLISMWVYVVCQKDRMICVWDNVNV